MPDNNWDTSLYDQKHSFVFEYGKDLLALLAPQPGERIMDLGCGTGHLARMIAESGATVVGLDRSPTMIEAARREHPHLEFVLADAADFSFPSPFDAVFSNATLHWVTEAEKAAACISAALKPGGRFVAEFGGKGNVARITAAVRESMREVARIEGDHGWYFPSVGEYATLLEKHGLAVRGAWRFDRLTKLEDGERGLRNWLAMFGQDLFRTLSAQAKESVLQKTEEKLRGVLFKGGNWHADYTRLRVAAYKA